MGSMSAAEAAAAASVAAVAAHFSRARCDGRRMSKARGGNVFDRKKGQETPPRDAVMGDGGCEMLTVYLASCVAPNSSPSDEFA